MMVYDYFILFYFILFFPLFPLMDFARHFLPSLSSDFSPIKKRLVTKWLKCLVRFFKMVSDFGGAISPTFLN